MEQHHPITVRACKASGHCYRWWTIQPIASNESGIVLDKAVGTLVHEPTGTWTSPYRIRYYYWFARWYNLLEVWRDEVFQEVYINVASPAVLNNTVLTYVDYELDVVRPQGQVAHVVDEDEFLIASSEYTLQIQAQCRSACDEALLLAAQWITGLDPLTALTQVGHLTKI